MRELPWGPPSAVRGLPFVPRLPALAVRPPPPTPNLGLVALSYLVVILIIPFTMGALSQAGIDLVHYPLTVPVPFTRRPRVITLHDVLHHDLPQLVSARIPLS